MTDYTVLLLYPDYLTDSFGQETYLAHVKADNVNQAIQKAQEEVISGNDPIDGLDYSKLEDFFPLFACAGHQKDIRQ